MAPVTPSPHRFLSGNRKAQSNFREAKAPSSLRRQLPQPTVEHHEDALQPSQFAQTPRFSHGKPRTSAESAQPATSQRPSLVEALRATARPAEDVEDATGFERADEMLLDAPDQVVQSVENPILEDQSDNTWSNHLAFSPKRRRVENPEGQQSTRSNPLEGLPSIERHFTHSFAPPSQSLAPIELGNTQRPAFVRPAVQAQEPSEPLPEAFSPHRRGQKFVAGGMAATLQQWVLETGQAAVQSRKEQEYLRGEEYVMRVKVEEVKGHGPFVLRAKIGSGDHAKLLLAGGTNVGGSRLNEIRLGCVVGIRAPTWEVDLDSQTYIVGVDWRIIS